jgi:tetratricopeptide (TPR) repeat protein
MLAIGLASPMWPQQPSLSGRVVDEDNRAIEGVTVRAQHFGEDTTSASGEFSIPLPDTIKHGAVIAVSVLPVKWVLKDFPDGYVTVRRDDMPRLTLRLARRGSLSLLTDARIRKLLEKSGTQSPRNRGPSQNVDLDALVLQKAAELGLSPIAVRQAIEDWVEHKASTTAHDRGLAAFYRTNFAGAVHEWEASAALKEADLVETYLLLGSAELSQFNTRKAAVWIHKAFELKPTDPTALMEMGQVCALQPDNDEREHLEKNAVGCQHEPLKYFDDALAQLRLEVPRNYLIEALWLVERLALYGLLNNFDDDVAKSELDRLVSELKQLEVGARTEDPMEGAFTSIMLGLMLLAKDDYAEAEQAFERALSLAKDQVSRDAINLVIQVPLGESYVDRGLVASGMEAYTKALDSCSRLDPGVARRYESEIHRLMAEASIHVPAVGDEPAPKEGELKAWWAQKASRLFKQVDQQRGGAFREQCALAVAVADGAALRQHQSINARLLCANSYLDLDQVEPASRYYAEAIELAKRMYPDGWREVVKLTYWTNIVGVLNLGEQYQKAVPIAVAMWELNKKMEYPLDFPPLKNLHPNYVSFRSSMWFILASELESIAKVSHSPGLVESRNEALAIRCYDAVTNMISVDPHHPQKSELEDFERFFARSECSRALEANPTEPEAYILRGFVYLAQADAVSSGASQPWAFQATTASQEAKGDLERAATLPERVDRMLKGSTRDLAAQLLKEVRRLPERP